jgi:hypothetical protein
LVHLRSDVQRSSRAHHWHLVRSVLRKSRFRAGQAGPTLAAAAPTNAIRTAPTPLAKDTVRHAYNGVAVPQHRLAFEIGREHALLAMVEGHSAVLAAQVLR